MPLKSTKRDTAVVTRPYVHMYDVYGECVSEMVTEGKCATDHAYDTTDKVKVPNETLYICLTFGRRKRF